MFSLNPILPAKTRSVAVLSDIHGNIRALDAVLADIAEQDINAVVCNGDFVTSSAHSVEVVDRIRQLSFPSTSGNHERYLQELADPANVKWKQANWAPTIHDYQVLSADARQWLTELPDTLLLCDGEAPLVMAHAAPGNDVARVTAQHTDNDWRALFANLPEGSTLIGSHLHWYWQHQWQGYQFVRTPPVGLPLDGDRRAGYLILRRQEKGWSTEQRRVLYDVESELAAFQQSDFYHEGGVIGHLFWEELRTARWRLVPFFSHLRLVSTTTALSPGVNGYDPETLQAALHTFDPTLFPEYHPDALGDFG
jgi:hypothetical protein